MEGEENYIGRVVGIYGRNLLRIAVSDEKLHLVAKPGTYLKLGSVDGSTLYAMVMGFNLIDELYRKGRIVEEIEGYLNIAFSRNEVSAIIVGYLDNGIIYKGVKSLPRPGEKVYLAETKELQEIMGRGELEIGTLSYNPEVKFSLYTNMLASRHMAILAMTGAGKSNTVAVLLAQLAEKMKFPRIIVIDTHSEYVPLQSLFPDKVRVFTPSGRIKKLVEARYGVSPSPLEIPLWTLGFNEIIGLLRLPYQATKQQLYLRNTLQEIRRKRWNNASADDPIYFSIQELKKAVTDMASRHQSDRSAIDLQLKVDNLIDNPDLYFITQPEISEEIYRKIEYDEPYRSGKAFVRIYERLFSPGINIIALGGLPSEVQISTVSTILKAIWRIVNAYSQAGSKLPLFIIVEEAHIYSPRDRENPSKEILEKIAKEGRKFGIGLGIVSQRPRELSPTLLAQCGTLIALRTSNPEDQRHILNSMEEVMTELIQSLSGLSVGEAIVSGPSAPLPAIVKIYNFQEIYNVELGGKDINWTKEWNKEPEETDILPFLFTHEERRLFERKQEGLDKFFK